MNEADLQKLALGDYAERDLPQIHPEKFWTDVRDNPADPLNPVKIDMCRWVKKGSPGSGVTVSIKKLQSNPPYWKVIGPWYEAWKKGHEAPVNGTPLSAWPGCRSEEAERFSLMRIYTVQDVAAMTDEVMDRFGMGARDKKTQALAFLAAGDQVKAASEAAALRQELDDTRAELAEAMAAIRDLKAKLPAEQPTIDVPQPRRGRPPKVAA